VAGNVLFVTVDQWRGDSLSALGHPLVETPNLDALAASGVLFANHWAVTAPCGPSRASLYTGTYLHRHRSALNGTPLDASLTNVALEARREGYDPVLFGYTDASVDPRAVPDGDPALFTYEGVLPGFRPLVHDPFEAGSLEWGKWLAARGRDVPSNPHRLYDPDLSYPGATDHPSTWAPGHFDAEETETAFITERVVSHLERQGDGPFFVHVSYLRPHPPYRNPPGYHDLYSLDDVPPFAAHATREAEQAVHPLLEALARMPGVGAAADERERRQLRATYHGMQAEVDAQLGRLFGWLSSSGLADDTLVVLTSDHGELGGDHWCVGKGGWFDASFRVPLVVRDPRAAAAAGRGRVVDAVTEAVDVMPTILEWIGAEVPLQADGWSLRWAIEGQDVPPHWRDAAHMEWDFRNPSRLLAERRWGLPSAHCVLTVLRSRDAKYVQFAADGRVLPPLLFDLEEDPGELHDVSRDPRRVGDCLRAARELLQWRMREDDRELANSLLTPDRGLVRVRDTWR
jgi:arylsulfatase A-like enzyme